MDRFDKIDMADTSSVVEAPVAHLIHTYRHQCSTVELPPGLGDFLRGSIALFQHCQRRNIRYTVDFSQHSLGQCIQAAQDQKMSDDKPLEYFNCGQPALRDFIDKIGPKTTSMVTSNVPPEAATSYECRQFLRKSLAFTPQFQQTVDDMMKRLNLVGVDYAVFHLRAGDHQADFENLNSGKQIFNPGHTQVLLQCIKDLIQLRFGNNVLIISDNQKLANHLATLANCKVTAITPVHLGRTTNGQAAADSLMEFALMANSRKVYSYSVYDWPSGFAHWCCEIFNVSFEQVLLGFKLH